MNLQGEWIRMAATAGAGTRNPIPAIIMLLVAGLVVWAVIRYWRSVYRKARAKAVAQANTEAQAKAAADAAAPAQPAPNVRRTARPLLAFQATDVLKEGRQENYRNWVWDLLAANPDTERYEGMSDDHIRDAGYFNEDEPVWELDLRGEGEIRLLAAADAEGSAPPIRVHHTRYGDLGMVPPRYAGKVDEVMQAVPYRIRWRISGGNYKYYNREHGYIKTTKAPYRVYAELLEE